MLVYNFPISTNSPVPVIGLYVKLFCVTELGFVAIALLYAVVAIAMLGSFLAIKACALVNWSGVIANAFIAFASEVPLKLLVLI